MHEPVFISAWNAESERTAVVAEEQDSVWLYLTEPDGEQPTHDCWILNTPAAPDEPDLQRYEEARSPPPAPRRLIEAEGKRAVPESSSWEFLWSDDGETVAVSLDGELLGLISSEIERGFSRHLREDSAWGNAWDDELLGELL
ncbi:MAG: hypothetical protein OEZ06_19270 [Myxococcales bacterium]|nr:hypothetical protein [Myxococcales bacterium]